MEITKKLAKNWSRVGSRAAFGMAAVDLGNELDQLMILTADVSTSAGLVRFKQTHPDKYLDVGIAEQNMIGIAAGLASEGKKVVTTTFAPFQSMRCLEQVRVDLAYMRHDVTMVGLASGLVLGTLGYTHCSIEDLAITRAIPNLTVLSPADCGETVKAFAAAVRHDGPVYVRLTGGAGNPIVYSEDYDFQIGKAVHLRAGEDVAIIATGTMVHKALEAAEQLAAQGVSASVVNMHTIKPFDTAAIDAACQSKLVVTVEEHNVVGGLGSAVAEYKSTLAGAPAQLIIGLEDEFKKSGAYTDMLEIHGLTPEKIAARIQVAL